MTLLRSDGYRILFVTSEVQPLMKTGGLADVSAALPAALRVRGHDVRVLTPAYADSFDSGVAIRPVPAFKPPDFLAQARLGQASLPEEGLPVWLLDVPSFSERSGSPYHDANGEPYGDNAQRFNHLCRIAAWIAAGEAGLSWQPDIVHCNEWHTGLVPVWLSVDQLSAASVFTIHNLAYQGLFPRRDFDVLGLPDSLWHHQALEFHGQLSCLKAGLQFADRLTTVSPTFAREILTPQGGEGLDGVLRERAGALTGIINGLDTRRWDPRHDPALARTYGVDSVEGKAKNTVAVRREMHLARGDGRPLVAVIGRLAFQKGIDVLIEALPELLALAMDVAIIGTGDRSYEEALKELAEAYPGRLAVRTAFDESLAHRLEAGAALLLMPSRYEPCGLTQMQSLRYGTVPVVGRCGGLVDTVVGMDAVSRSSGTATGFFIDPLSPTGIVAAMKQALACYDDAQTWRGLMQRGMQRDFSWDRSARSYEKVYRDAVVARRQGPAGVPR